MSDEEDVLGEQEMAASMEKTKDNIKEGEIIQTSKLIKNSTYTRITHASK